MEASNWPQTEKCSSQISSLSLLALFLQLSPKGAVICLFASFHLFLLTGNLLLSRKSSVFNLLFDKLEGRSRQPRINGCSIMVTLIDSYSFDDGIIRKKWKTTASPNFAEVMSASYYTAEYIFFERLLSIMCCLHIANILFLQLFSTILNCNSFANNRCGVWDMCVWRRVFDFA